MKANKIETATVSLSNKPKLLVDYRFLSICKCQKGDIVSMYLGISRSQEKSNLQLYAIDSKKYSELYESLNVTKCMINEGRSGAKRIFQIPRTVQIDNLDLEIIPRLSSDNRNIGIVINVNDRIAGTTFTISVTNSEFITFVDKLKYNEMI